ncbi:DNA mismatch repair protein Mlh1 [Fasciola hepatica]|uniref:DNA mismatch repair protein Mlh1 n=1 Tax=Fasciola hepatica TaxID=6192 RepID=A0A4E0R9A2_FASHE|nr:DNA mismatch repair protein Mlh1 [Fasciola hepatica]
MNGFQSDHVQEVSRTLSQLFKNHQFTDVTLSLHGSEFQSNRMLLACSSAYFRALLEFKPQLMTESHFDISSPYLTLEGFSYLIRFINSLGQDCPKISPDTYESVYVAASFLQVTSLQHMLSELISQNLTPTNVLGALKLAHVFDDHVLYRKSMFVLLDRFDEIDFFSEDFVALEENQLERIMLSDDLNVSREGTVIRALLAWVSHDVNTRTEFFRRVFVRLLRLPLVKASDLKHIVTIPEFAVAREAISLLVWAYRTLTGPFVAPRTVPQQGPPDVSILPEFDHICHPRTGTNFRIHAIGGLEELSIKLSSSAHPNHCAEFLLYDHEVSMATPQIAPTEPARVHHAIATTLSWIYLVGGESEEGQLMSHCTRYNLVERAWFPMAGLDAPRSHHQIVCVETYVYAFGGYRLNWATGYSPATDSILVYDAIVNQWTTAPHRLPFAPIDFGVCLIPSKRMIMLAGGLHEHAVELRPTDRVLLYDPAEDSHACFITLPRLPLPLTGLALVYDEAGDQVFACGGQTDSTFAGQPNVIAGYLFGQILSFSFDSNTWSFVTVLDCPRYRASALLHRSTLYVLGGITVDEVVERTAHLFTDSASDLSAESSADWEIVVQQKQALIQLGQINPARPSLLQAPFHTCHVIEAWSLREPVRVHHSMLQSVEGMIDVSTDQTGEDEDVTDTSRLVRIRRLRLPPARYSDGCPVLPRCLSNYCIAPYFS